MEHPFLAKYPNKAPFEPINNSYKKVYASIPEEITREHFGFVTHRPEEIMKEMKLSRSPIPSNYVPRKELGMYMNANDIPGTSPRSNKVIKGVKRAEFFPQEPVTNEYYNKEARGGNTSMKGHFENSKYAPFNQR